MQRAEKVVGLICIGIGAFMVWQGWLMDLDTKLGPGPGSFPQCIGVVFCLLSGSWLLSALKRSEYEAGAHFLPDRRGLLRIGAIKFTPQVRAGEVRVLGIMDKETSRFLPGVKTVESQG